ncbi:hypothetical protein [Streptomyces sp. MspMP-M5]|uniref:hypothetical protein n=1 Tax=unclassified Streptomyces TaxID=2593676 RepID=UPI00037359DC|nr:hypothetical protein [Streptomyces sp. MspMP-M5]MYT28276.1 hypothetical protein [Streptomyces sp. SID8354]
MSQWLQWPYGVARRVTVYRRVGNKDELVQRVVLREHRYFVAEVDAEVDAAVAWLPTMEEELHRAPGAGGQYDLVGVELLAPTGDQRGRPHRMVRHLPPGRGWSEVTVVRAWMRAPNC